jgi:hypothetical protein
MVQQAAKETVRGSCTCLKQFMAQLVAEETVPGTAAPVSYSWCIWQLMRQSQEQLYLSEAIHGAAGS